MHVFTTSKSTDVKQLILSTDIIFCTSPFVFCKWSGKRESYEHAEINKRL